MSEEYRYDEQGRARIILPPEGLGKIIQVKIKEPEDWLFMGDKSTKIHSDIFKDVLKRFSLDYEWKEIGDRWIIEPEGNNYLLIGAGKTKRRKNHILIGEGSFDYPVMFNRDCFNEKTKPFIPEEIEFEFKNIIV